MKSANFTTILLISAIALILLATTGNAAVYSINGTVNRTDNNTRIIGATILNGTNTTTSNADGAWGLSNMQNNTGSTGWQITYRAPGFTQQINYTNVSGANNITNNVSLTPLTPTVSGVTEASITNTGATISWTVTATDNINNNFVANRVLYTLDSNRANNLFYTSWSNNTASPSFTLSNLELSKTWYYTVQTYNIQSGTYSATSTGDFVTTHGKPASTYRQQQQQQPVQYMSPNSAPPPQGTITTTIQNNKPKIVFFLIVILVLGYFVLDSSGSKGKGKGSRRK